MRLAATVLAATFFLHGGGIDGLLGAGRGGEYSEGLAHARSPESASMGLIKLLSIDGQPLDASAVR